MLSNRGREGCRREVADRAVWPDLVVVPAPGRDHRPGVLERGEPVFVEALVAELAVEAFDVGVLRRFARLDQHQLHAVGLRPLVERPAGELGALIGSDCRRVAAETTDRFEQVRHALAVDPAGRRDLHRFLRAVIDDRQM